MKNMVGLGLPEYSFNTTHKALIVGAGLAGCAIANALAQRGYRCALFDENTSVAAGASALPVAVVRPAIGGDAFYKTYFNHAFDLCCNSFPKEIFNQCGALELTNSSFSDNDETYNTDFVTAAQASSYAGTKLNSDAFYIRNAGVVVPRCVCDQWVTHPLIDFHPATRVSKLEKTQYGWQLIANNEKVIGESQLVILATAAATEQFNVTSEVPLQQVVGQIDRFECSGQSLQCVVNGRGYLTPDTLIRSSGSGTTGTNTREDAQGIWCGATHHHRATDAAITDADSAANRATATDIAPQLTTAASPSASFAEARTFTPDRLPVVGAVPDTRRYRTDYVNLKHGKPADSFPAPVFHHGLYLAAGLGSRGATQALLIGELMASLITGEHGCKPDQPQHRNFQQQLHPGRFLLRALRRGL